MTPKFNPKSAVILAVAGLMILGGCSSTPSSSSSASSQAVSSQSSAQSTISRAMESSQAQASSAASAPAPSSAVLQSTQLTSVPIKAPATVVPESTKADFSYLDDAVFIGDSVSLKLKNYVTAKRKTNAGFFGKAQFLTAGSMGSGNALQPLSATSIHPSYNGKKALLEDNVAAMGAKKIYIMLGMNDIAPYGADGAVNNMTKLIARIQAKSPDAKIFVQSATPIIKNMQMTSLNNPNLADYDYKLSVMCKENGYYFVDVASVMRDKEGNLPLEYCSDPDVLGMHFTDKACEIWIDYLLKHTVK
jgi:lysophospholipase L1-like esterase/guanyl-specific ribonuclease Sa